MERGAQMGPPARLPASGGAEPGEREPHRVTLEHLPVVLGDGFHEDLAAALPRGVAEPGGHGVGGPQAVPVARGQPWPCRAQQGREPHGAGDWEVVGEALSPLRTPLVLPRVVCVRGWARCRGPAEPTHHPRGVTPTHPGPERGPRGISKRLAEQPPTKGSQGSHRLSSPLP